MARQASPRKQLPHQQQQREQQQQHQQQQQQQHVPTGNDDELPSAPPAFPQPFTSLPRNQAAQYFPTSPHAIAAQAAAAAAAAAQQQQQQQRQYTPPVLPISSRAYSETLPGQQQLHLQQQAGHTFWGSAAAATTLPYHHTTSSSSPYAAAAVASSTAVGYPSASAVFPNGSSSSFPEQHGYGADGGLPLVCGPGLNLYPGVVYAAAAYGGDAAVPLLSAGYPEDMVFANRQVRHAFLRKVLCLMTVQLLLTAAIAAPIHMSKAARQFLHANPWVCGLAVIITFTVLLIMAWSESARRTHPTNQILLAVFTAANGLLIGVVSATYSTPVLLLGLLVAATVSLALIVYAAQTSVDFTASGGMLYSAVVVLLVVSLADWFLGFKTLHLLKAGCGALLFSAYLVYDIQLLASGESWYQVSADEYVFATINVFTDVISMFMYVLQVLTQMQGSDHDY